MKQNAPIGVGTLAGLAGAVAQFVTAVLNLAFGGPSEVTIAALATATGTLITVLAGRYAQAVANRPATTPRAPVYATTAGTAGPFTFETTGSGDVADDEPGDPDGLPELEGSDQPDSPDGDDQEHAR